MITREYPGIIFRACVKVLASTTAVGLCKKKKSGAVMGLA